MTNSPDDGAAEPGPAAGTADPAAPGSAAESFDAFYLREYPRLVDLAHALTGSRTYAEDIAQEAMLAGYRRWDEVARLDLPVAWVRRVCANLACSVVRRRVVEARAMVRLRSRPPAVVELDPDDGDFWSQVRRLPRRQAQCVALTYVYDMSVADVAAALDCAEGTVKSHLARGRSRLAARLGEVDVVPGGAGGPQAEATS